MANANQSPKSDRDKVLTLDSKSGLPPANPRRISLGCSVHGKPCKKTQSRDLDSFVEPRHHPITLDFLTAPGKYQHRFRRRSLNTLVQSVLLNAWIATDMHDRYTHLYDEHIDHLLALSTKYAYSDDNPWVKCATVTMQIENGKSSYINFPIFEAPQRLYNFFNAFRC